jgi:type II secretory ATPase GspE/PulE/Tfp pilus assembly ATPase PilB-like protein
MIEKVAIDRVSKLVFVDRRHAGDPQLLTWQDRNRANGNPLQIKPCDVDEVARYRANGMRAGTEEDEDLHVRNRALEILSRSAQYRASDVHFMLRGAYTEIQVVIKGDLRVLERCSQAEGVGLIRAIYQGIATIRDDSYKPLEFQNAQISADDLPPDSGLSSARIVRGPAYPQAQDGAFMTIRLQYLPGQGKVLRKDLSPLELPRPPEGELALGAMGYTDRQVEKIKTLMDSPNGLIIFTGPTGSGKTTTIFEALQHAARTKPQRRQVTIEEPVEYPMEWAVQMAVTGTKNDKESGAEFIKRVQVALRMAPNTVLVGEIRGPEVAVAALEAGLTGHQVLSTMHVTDLFLFVERMEIMDRQRLDRRVFCDHKIVRGAVAQRLVPKLCPECSRPLAESPGALSERIVLALQTWGSIDKVRVKGQGCEECGGDGTLGRFAVAEVVVMDAKVMADFIEHGSDVARANYRARADADPSMLETAINHVLAGELDPRSVEDSVDLIESKDKV